MAITNYDGIIAARGAGKGDDFFIKKTSIAWRIGDWHSYVMSSGNQASATYAAASAGGSLMSDTMVGAIRFKGCSGGDSKYLLSWGVGAVDGSEAGGFGLIDILWAGSSFVLSDNTTIAINSQNLTRSTDGKFNHLGIMKRTALTQEATVTVFYTDAGDVATSVDVIISTLGASGQLLPIRNIFVPINNGIKNVQSIQSHSVILGGGSLDFFIFKLLDVIPAMGPYGWTEKDMTAQIDGIVKLDIDSSNNPGFITPIALGMGTTGRAFHYMVKTCAG